MIKQVLGGVNQLLKLLRMRMLLNTRRGLVYLGSLPGYIDMM